MKKNKRVLSIYLINCLLYAHAISYVDFDVSMQKAKHLFLFSKIPINYRYRYFCNLYHRLQSLHKNNSTPVPHIIHQIWLGGEFPAEFRVYQQSWLNHHPTWQYTLWTDADVHDFPFINRDLFDAATNPGEKSDIWRYEILLRYGGLYVDVDFESLRPFDELNQLYDFYIGLQPLDTGQVQVGIGLIGSIANHPLLQCAVQLLRTSHAVPIVLRTGPLFFTQIIMQYALQTEHCDAILPASYFYPCGYTQKGKPKDEWIFSESYAVHHWAGSWLSKK